MIKLNNKIYIVWGWNNESYEDSYEWIDSVWDSEDRAQDRINNLKAKYVKDDCYNEPIYNIKEFVLNEVKNG